MEVFLLSAVLGGLLMLGLALVGWTLVIVMSWLDVLALHVLGVR